MSLGIVRWRALGTTVELLVSDPRTLVRARTAVAAELDAIDRACSRFREDSELTALNAAAGRGPFPVSPLLRAALAAALDAAERTDGAVTPTLGAAIVAAGYDRSHEQLTDDPRAFVPQPAGDRRAIRIDGRAGTVDLPAGVVLDLGATAKGLAADRAAAAAVRAGGAGGALVSLGGDVAVAGERPGGWAVGIADDHRDPQPPTTVRVDRGGLATSGLTLRRWRRGGRTLHHVLDPVSGRPVAPVWRTASVAADSCLDAEVHATAALVWGDDAPRRLAAAGIPARLVAADGTVVVVGGWPADAAPLGADRAPASPIVAGNRRSAASLAALGARRAA